MENEIFKMAFDNLKRGNTSKEEWQAIRALADDRAIAIKRADKGSCVAAWDRMDHLLEAEKQYERYERHERYERYERYERIKSVDFKEKLFTDLVESSNNMFLNLKRKGLITIFYL